MLKCGDDVKTRYDITCDGGIWDYHVSIEKGESGVVVNVSIENEDVCCDVFFNRKDSSRSRVYKNLSITHLFLESGTKLEKIGHLAFTRQLKKNKASNVRKYLEKRDGKPRQTISNRFKNRILEFVKK